MGKKQVMRLLEQLKANQQMELQNAAAIFTVAQVAVNELQEQSQDIEPTVTTLPSAPALLDKTELLRRYGSYNGCRKAARQQGIKFSQAPSWKQLVVAFSYADACQHIIGCYTEAYPNPELHNITIELKLG